MILINISLDLFTPFVIFIGFGYFLGFITSYMIFRINELELKNKLLEERILQTRNDNLKQEKKEEPKKEEEKIEKEEKKEEENIKKEEEEKKDDDNEKKNLNTVENIIKEEPNKSTFKPPEIKERKNVEEDWTLIKKKGKKKKPH